MQQFMIFRPERFFLMVFFLPKHIFNDPVNMRMRIRKNSIALLPIEFIFTPFFIIDKFIAFNLDLLYKVGNANEWF